MAGKSTTEGNSGKKKITYYFYDLNSDDDEYGGFAPVRKRKMSCIPRFATVVPRNNVVCSVISYYCFFSAEELSDLAFSYFSGR